MSERRMNAYYYGFTPTGVEVVDLILHAVACAGKAYHHTESWCDTCRAYGECEGESPVAWIQNAANKAGKVISAAYAAGRVAGLREAADICRARSVYYEQQEQKCGVDDSVRCIRGIQRNESAGCLEQIERAAQDGIQPTKESDSGKSASSY